MKVLVTGASGFIGARVLAQLHSNGVDAVGVSRGSSPTGKAWASFDLLDPLAPAALITAIRPTHLLHLAWNATPGRFWTAPDNVAWAASTASLVRAFWDKGGQRIVGAGTVAEYDWSSSVLGEASVVSPATLYGAAKDSVRRLLEAAAIQEQRSFAWGRIFWLYGPGEQRNRLVSDVAANLATGDPVECSEGLQERDFLHVDDVAGAFVAALTSDWRGVFNIGSGQATAVRDVISRLGALSGRPELISYGARPSPPNDPPRLVADIGVLKNELGFRPRWNLEDGLADAFAYWKDQGLSETDRRR